MGTHLELRGNVLAVAVQSAALSLIARLPLVGPLDHLPLQLLLTRKVESVFAGLDVGVLGERDAAPGRSSFSCRE